MPSLRMLIPASAEDVQPAAVRLHICLLPLLVLFWLAAPLGLPLAAAPLPLAGWLVLLAPPLVPLLLHVFGWPQQFFVRCLVGTAIIIVLMMIAGSWPAHPGEASGGLLVLSVLLAFPLAYVVSSATYFVRSGGIGRGFSACLQRLRHPFGGGGSAAPSR